MNRAAAPQFSSEQQAVIDRVLAPPNSSLATKIAAITGPPGSGKTTLSEGIMGGWTRMFGRSSSMALSPTGKAARRFKEVTGHPCATIHRALVAWEKAAKALIDDPSSSKNAEWGSPSDIVPRGSLRAVLIDEASMVDMQLMLRLMQALPPWTERIVLVGDSDQLPSVGAGCVLRDVMASGYIPTFRLTRIYRQDDDSWIRVNTQRINQGERPIADPNAIDWFESICEDALSAVDQVVALAKEHPNAQVLTPTHRGPLGAENLNRLVREAVNPIANRTGWTAGETTFFRGDRVVHKKNNYGLGPSGVFNGETALVVGPVPSNDDDDRLAVDYGYEEKVLYDRETAAKELRLAFALTVHSFQGSETTEAIIVVHSSHSFLLNRQILYTAASRAREKLWIVGNEKGIVRAVKHSQTVQRRTRLTERLREKFTNSGCAGLTT